MKIKRSNKLGAVLIEQGLLSEDDLTRALEHQGSDNKRLGEVLIDLKMLSPTAMLGALARHLNHKACYLRHGLIDPEVARLLSKEEAVRLNVLPLFKVGNRLTVAMAEPQSLRAIDQLTRLTGCEINPVLSLPSNIAEYQEKYLGEQVDIDSFLVGLTESNVEVVEHETVEDQSSHELGRMVEGSPVINLVNYLVLQAVRKNASDIHIEPGRKFATVRYRVDGQLVEVLRPRRDIYPAIVSRIKVMARLDIAEKR
ncbi:MAG: Flp pilus assembly complex ATPase component TadA, partial [Phycisphaerae bacterium]|nr:Flp pilus assembly complex ATPase component TadA [Phycisphaerae bacterium]